MVHLDKENQLTFTRNPEKNGVVVINLQDSTTKVCMFYNVAWWVYGDACPFNFYEFSSLDCSQCIS